MAGRGCALVLVIGGLVALASPAPEPTSPRILPNGFDYQDDHDGRRLADIRLKIVERDGERTLEITISAVGPQVEAARGFAGVRGANLHTAEQIENILEGRSHFAVTTQAQDGQLWTGAWRGGRRGPIPERRLGPDGRIDFLGVTPRDYALELIVETGIQDDGRHTTELCYEGGTRLRLVYDVVDATVRIVAFESLGVSEDSALAALKETEGPPRKEPNPPVRDEDWNARDLEGKWALFQKLGGDDDRVAKAFVAYAAGRNEFDFLEMIALHAPPFRGGISAAWALTNADAPQWLRVAAWMRQQDFGLSHGESETTKILLKHNAPKALAWLEKFAKEAALSKGEVENPLVAGRTPQLLQDLAALQKSKVALGELGKALPPLDPAQVFRHLDPPKQLVDFADRTTAEPGKVYLHQMLRTIKALVYSGRFRQPWIGKLHQLTRHPHLDVRQAAYLGFADLMEWVDPKEGPVDEFRGVLDDAKEPAAIREAALVAFSQSRHPQVAVRLLEMAAETEHPAWRAAISALSNVGDEFVFQTLKRVDKTKLPAKNAEFLERVREDFRRWLEDPGRSRGITSASYVESRLERAAWAEVTESPVAKAMRSWTREHFVAEGDAKTAALVEAVRKDYRPSHPMPDAAALTARVRGLAAEIAAALNR